MNNIEEAETSEAPANGAEGGSDNAAPRQRGGRRHGRSEDGGGRGKGRGRGRARTREKEEKEFDEEVLDIARVTRVVKGGRRLRFRATVVIGDRKGRVGLGTGKSVEVAVGVQKAVAAAKKRLIRVPMVNGTIPHEIKYKYKSARILLMPAKLGTGIIAGGALRKISDLAGIQNIIGKSYGTNNKLVNAQAMMNALQIFRKGKMGEKKPEAGEKKE